MPHSSESLKIVLVDDEPAARAHLSAVLKGWGHQVLACSTALEALGVLAGEPDAHVLLTDWLMPELDGVELCRLVRQAERPSSAYLHVLLLTARSDREDLLSALEAGADAFVTKSSDSTELLLQLKVVARLVQGRRELELARQAAEQASRVKSEFLANLSHEIRTPMHGVLGMVEHLQNTRLDTDQQEYASLIQQSAQNLLVILNDLLDFSKIEAGQLQVESIPMSPAEVAGEALAPFVVRAGESGIALLGSWERDVPVTLHGDPSRFRQVLMNLISNAVKFTSQGSVELHLRVDGPQLVAAVSDTGVGLTPEQQEAVFQPFTQAHLSVQRIYGGTGLGLTIVQRLTELMGGRVDLTSRPGEGTRVEVRVPLSHPSDELQECPAPARCLLLMEPSLPESVWARSVLEGWGWSCSFAPSSEGPPPEWVLADPAAAWQPWQARSRVVVLPPPLGLEPPAAAPAVVARPLTTSSLVQALGSYSKDEVVPAGEPAPEHGERPLDVLVAEDNPIGRTVVRLLLEKAGCQVTLVGNGTEAAETLRRHSFDLALLDVQMPGKDGKEVTRELRSLEQQRGAGRLPVAALTAQAFDSDREACLAAGMDFFLTKPLRREELLQILDSLR